LNQSIWMRVALMAWWLAILVLLLAFGVWIDPWLHQDSPWSLKLLNAFPIWLLFFALTALLTKVWPSVLIVLGLVGFVFYINALKLLELNQPLLLTDLFLLGQVFGHLDLLTAYIDLRHLLLVTTLGLIGAWVLFRTEPRTISSAARIGLIGIGLLGVIWLSTPMGQRSYTLDSGPDRPWAPIERLKANGWLVSAILSMHEDLVRLPSPDRYALADLKSQLNPDSTLLPEPMPDIVIILSESFFESRHLRGVDFCSVMVGWCELLEQGIHGEMTVPTFGGNTTRTEYELLTGVPYAHLPDGIYPYTSVVLQPSASLAWWLSHLGYRTTAIHPHDRYFWQRHRAMPLLGFDAFIGEQEFGAHRRSGFWISDDDLTTRILDTLDEGTAPQFVFAISMENHGPWNAKQPNMDQSRLANIPTPSGLNERGKREWRNYTYHQQNAIDALDRLVRSLETRDRPSLVLFFGDHLPGLHQTFQQLGMENGWAPLTHPVPFVLLTQNMEPQITRQKPSASHQLGLWALEAAGLPLPAGYRLLLGNTEPDPTTTEQTIYPYLTTLNPADWQMESCAHLAQC